MIKKIIIIVFIITSCSPAKVQYIPENISYDMRGYVEDVKLDNNGEVVALLVNGQDLLQERYDYGWAAITPKTEIFLNGSKIDKYYFESNKYTIVYIVFDGSVAESYPVQGGALEIYIDKEN